LTPEYYVLFLCNGGTYVCFLIYLYIYRSFGDEALFLTRKRALGDVIVTR